MTGADVRPVEASNGYHRHFVGSVAARSSPTWRWSTSASACCR
jgi:hypothetical protein